MKLETIGSTTKMAFEIVQFVMFRLLQLRLLLREKSLLNIALCAIVLTFKRNNETKRSYALRKRIIKKNTI